MEARSSPVFLEKFIDESIDVLDIQVLTNSDFEKLGISSIGINQNLLEKQKIIHNINEFTQIS